MKTIIFLGAKDIGFRCLQYLNENQQNFSAQIVGVLTNPANKLNVGLDWYGYCAQQGLPVFEQLSEIPPCDFIVSVQYHRILRARHIAQASKIAVNLHLAPLPEYRGCNQFSFAIAESAPLFGVTLHRLEKGIDSGDILFEHRFPIPQHCFVRDLYDLTCHHAFDLFAKHISDVLSQNYRLVPQESLLSERKCSYHFRHEIDQLKQIDLNWEAEKIERYIRATWFPPFEPPYTFIGQKKVYFQPKE